MTQLNEALISLFTEVFRGTPPGASGTWFVEGDEALDDTLNNLTALEASIQVAAGANSIAAHVRHMAYYLELTIQAARGQTGEADWPGSWAIQTVNEDEWNTTKAMISERALTFLGLISEANWEAQPESLTGALANLGHAAYHLGAVRQLYLVVKSR